MCAVLCIFSSMHQYRWIRFDERWCIFYYFIWFFCCVDVDAIHVSFIYIYNVYFHMLYFQFTIHTKLFIELIVLFSALYCSQINTHTYEVIILFSFFFSKLFVWLLIYLLLFPFSRFFSFLLFMMKLLNDRVNIHFVHHENAQKYWVIFKRALITYLILFIWRNIISISIAVDNPINYAIFLFSYTHRISAIFHELQHLKTWIFENILFTHHNKLNVNAVNMIKILDQKWSVGKNCLKKM